MHTNCTCYLNLAAVVEQLDVVRMWMWSCGERKLLHHLHASQVAAAPSVYDDAHRTFLHNSLGMELIEARVSRSFDEMITIDLVETTLTIRLQTCNDVVP